MIRVLYSPSVLSLLHHLLDLEAEPVLCDEYTDLVYLFYSILDLILKKRIVNAIILLIHWIPSFGKDLAFIPANLHLPSTEYHKLTDDWFCGAIDVCNEVQTLPCML
jgi:hypothetical protein